jgi:hypothetical protein
MNVSRTNAVLGTIRAIERPLVDGLYALLLLACVIAAGWLVARHDHYWDWTRERGNSLSPESVAIIKRLDSPLSLTVFVDQQSSLGQTIGRLLARYRSVLPGIQVRFLDPQRFPEQAREAKVFNPGQIMLDYRGRRETLNEVGERAVTAAIARLATTRPPWVAVLEGHGERRIDGDGAADLGRFGQELKELGLQPRGLDLTVVPEVPANAQLVLLSNPDIALFPGEAEGLTRYLDRGGNLIMLLDPGPLNGLEAVLYRLGISRLPGTVIDNQATEFAAEPQTVAVISEFPDDALGSGLKVPALLPGAVAFETRTAPGWTLAGALRTGAESWNETGRTTGKVSHDEVIGEQGGPLPVILALTRALTRALNQDRSGVGREQRVLVVGDGDFLSNAQLGAYGNRDLGLKLIRWVSGEEDLLPLPAEPVPAEGLILDRTRRLVIGLGTLVILPGLFLVSGLIMRWLRSRG